MLSEYRWPREKFEQAVAYMATSSGSLQDRLLLAMTGPFVAMRAELLPVDLRTEWDRLHGRMTAMEATGDEGDYAATILNLSDDEAKAEIELICRMSADVAVAEGTVTPAT